MKQNLTIEQSAELIKRANYDFKSGHCKAECVMYDTDECAEENGY